VAGNTHFTLTGGRIDAVAEGLAGFAVLLVIAEVTMFGTYRRLGFSASFWSFTFTYAAAVTNGIAWVSHLRGAVARPASWVLLTVVTLFIGAIAVRSALELARGTFLPREPLPTPEPAVNDN
jgi:tellurite resistance protein